MGIIYKILPVTNAKDYFDKCIEAVTGQSKLVRQMMGLLPLIYSLEIGKRAIEIAGDGLRNAGLIKIDSPKACPTERN